ncbi:hypothetical protein PINS_up013733 [Pythium insidiosum]|nr:hypothetical protein PINS_up013733 [Pythium insidiosum]
MRQNDKDARSIRCSSSRAMEPSLICHHGSIKQFHQAAVSAELRLGFVVEKVAMERDNSANETNHSRSQTSTFSKRACSQHERDRLHKLKSPAVNVVGFGEADGPSSKLCNPAGAACIAAYINSASIYCASYPSHQGDCNYCRDEGGQTTLSWQSTNTVLCCACDSHRNQCNGDGVELAKVWTYPWRQRELVFFVLGGPFLRSSTSNCH